MGSVWVNMLIESFIANGGRTDSNWTLAHTRSRSLAHSLSLSLFSHTRMHSQQKKNYIYFETDGKNVLFCTRFSCCLLHFNLNFDLWLTGKFDFDVDGDRRLRCGRRRAVAAKTRLNAPAAPRPH